MGFVPIGQLPNIMGRCKGIRFQKSLWKSDLWHHGAVLLITVPSVGKSLRLLAHLPTFVHDFQPHSWRARDLHTAVEQYQPPEPEIASFCFRLSRTFAKTHFSFMRVEDVTYGLSDYSLVVWPSVGFFVCLCHG